MRPHSRKKLTRFNETEFADQKYSGPCPIHEVVVRAVMKAVSAATIIFATISMIFFFIEICF